MGDGGTLRLVQPLEQQLGGRGGGGARAGLPRLPGRGGPVVGVPGEQGLLLSCHARRLVGREGGKGERSAHLPGSLRPGADSHALRRAAAAVHTTRTSLPAESVSEKSGGRYFTISVDQVR